MSASTIAPPPREPVGVVGSGSWGTTLAKVAADLGHPVWLWARRAETAEVINAQRENHGYLPGVVLPEGLRATADLAELAGQCRLILFVVPSHGFREVASELGRHLDGEHVLVHGTKGIEQGSFKRMSEVLREETCVRKLGVLSGPNLARELARGEPTGTLVASAYEEVYRRARAALEGPTFRVYHGHDVIGAEVGGAFKNVVALAAGVAAGLGLGENTKALLLTRGLAEMARLGTALGADVLTFGGMAGFGDLVATCASPLSRNHQVGVRLARGEALADIQRDMRMVAEGVKTTFAVHELCERRGFALPIVTAVRRLLLGGTARGLLDDLAAIPTGSEFVRLLD